MTVTYVHGYEKPANCTVLFQSVTNSTPPQIRNINGTSKCVSIEAHHTYNIFAIDGDASPSDLKSAMYLANFSINYTVPASGTDTTSGLYIWYNPMRSLQPGFFMHVLLSESTEPSVVSVTVSEIVWIGTGVGELVTIIN